MTTHATVHARIAAYTTDPEVRAELADILGLDTPLPTATLKPTAALNAMNGKRSIDTNAVSVGAEPAVGKYVGDPMLHRPKTSTAPEALRNLAPAAPPPRKPVALTAECGTESGARRHRRNRARGMDDPTCDACKAAQVVANRARREAKR